MTAAGDTAAMPTPCADLIDQYAAHLAALGHPASTIETYRYPLQRADRELPAGLLAEPEWLADWLAGHPSWSTRGVYRAALTGFYRWAYETQRLSADPSTELPVVRKRRRLPRPTIHEQVRVILAKAREPVRLWSLLMAYAGLRCCEVAALQLPDDVTEQVIYVQGKGDIERIVPTHPDIWFRIAELPPGPLAGGAGRKSISQRCNREYRRLGLSGVTAHRLRHWYGTYVQAAGGNVRVTQRLMGHSHVTTTEAYTAVADEALRGAVLGLPRLA